MTWHQLVEWQQYYELEPFGAERADLRSAMAGCAIVNEIRTIAAGLSGQRNVKMLQVSDLMMPKRNRKGDGEARRAAEYASKWQERHKEKLEQLKSNKPATSQKPSKPPKRSRKKVT